MARPADGRAFVVNTAIRPKRPAAEATLAPKRKEARRAEAAGRQTLSPRPFRLQVLEASPAELQMLRRPLFVDKGPAARPLKLLAPF